MNSSNIFQVLITTSHYIRKNMGIEANKNWPLLSLWASGALWVQDPEPLEEVFKAQSVVGMEDYREGGTVFRN